jgi:hypothetical protein
MWWCRPDDTILPEELVMVLDDDGNELVLGSGSFGKVWSLYRAKAKCVLVHIPGSRSMNLSI